MSAEPANASVPMVYCMCYRCGVPYALPRYFQEQRREDGRKFYCPNGHDAVYIDAWKRRQALKRGEDPAGDLVKRQEKVRQIHEQEQAEAREADAKAAEESKGRAAELDGKPAVACPHCGRAFRNRGAMCSHVVQKHGGA